jgi:hypothetical protein
MSESLPGTKVSLTKDEPMNPLQSRLAVLRRRLRTVVTFRGACWALAALVGSVALACLFDQAVYLKTNRDLPALIRAVFLLGVLGGTGYVTYRFLLRPLRVHTDDLALALRVEEQYPILNDALASTVQFLEQSNNTPGVSPALQREAVQRALRLAAGCDFNKAIDARGTRPAFLALVGAFVLVVPLVLLHPGLAMTSLARLADPFGLHRWPGHLPQTTLEITFPARIGYGQKFVIRGQVGGAIPDKATIEFLGLSPSPQFFKIDKATGRLNAAIDMTQQRRDFRFRVRAGDAVSPPEEGTWHSVELRHPPSLAPLGGKPSPQMVLFYPAYTDLESPHKLSPGSGNINNAPAGTFVKLRGAANRPITRVWVEHRPLPGEVMEASYLAPFGPRQPVEALALLAGGHAVWGRTYGTIKPDRKEFVVDFQPWTKGMYGLALEDAEGLTRVYEFEENIVADPVPLVSIVRPAGSQSVLPNAEIRFDVLARDEIYAVRSVYLEYRRRGKDGKFLDSGPTRIPLYDHATAGAAIPQALAAFAAMPIPVVGPPARLRPKVVQAGKRWSLEGLVEEGDTLLVQACAHDFNDVVAFNVPGRSPVIELRVVGRTQFKNQLDDAQAKLQQDLVRLREQQDEALKKVRGAEQQWRATGKLRPEDVVDVAEAEGLQKTIQERIGTKPDEGLRGEIARLRETLRDNKLPDAVAEGRLKAMQEELARLAREHLPEIEPRLTNARRELENKADAQPPSPKTKGDLGRARENQEEVRRSLNDLLKYMDNWADMQQVRGELRKLEEEQRRLQEETEKLELDTRKGKQPGQPDKGKKLELTPEQEVKLKRLAAEQRELAEQLQNLLGKMQRMAEERAVKDPQGAEKLQKAVEIAKRDQIAEEIRDTGKQLHDPTGEIKGPQLNRAISNQEESIKTLQQMAEAMQEGRDAEIERLLQKQRTEGKNLEELADRLERLRKKAKEAKTKEERQKIAEEERQLQEEVEKKARELARLQAPQAGKALDQAAQKMERAAKQLDQGEDGEEEQKEALKQLQEAQKKLAQAQERTEEELARERLARIADQIKGLKDRQDAAIAESERLHKGMLRSGFWPDALLNSLGSLADTQEGLGKETARLKEKLKGAAVFELILDKTVKAMDGAASKMRERQQAALKAGLKRAPGEKLDKAALAAEAKAQERTDKLQKEASRRLQRLIDAVKPDPNVAQRPKKKDEKKDGPKEGDPKQAKKGGMPGDGIPAIAQLKALRAEQQEVNDRTREFAEAHPDEAKLGPNEQAELSEIRQDQERLFELFQKMNASANAAPAGGGNNP